MIISAVATIWICGKHPQFVMARRYVVVARIPV